MKTKILIITFEFYSQVYIRHIKLVIVNATEAIFIVSQL